MCAAEPVLFSGAGAKTLRRFRLIQKRLIFSFAVFDKAKPGAGADQKRARSATPGYQLKLTTDPTQ